MFPFCSPHSPTLHIVGARYVYRWLIYWLSTSDWKCYYFLKPNLINVEMWSPESSLLSNSTHLKLQQLAVWSLLCIMLNKLVSLSSISFWYIINLGRLPKILTLFFAVALSKWLYQKIVKRLKLKFSFWSWNSCWKFIIQYFNNWSSS